MEGSLTKTNFKASDVKWNSISIQSGREGSLSLLKIKADIQMIVYNLCRCSLEIFFQAREWFELLKASEKVDDTKIDKPIPFHPPRRNSNFVQGKKNFWWWHSVSLSFLNHKFILRVGQTDLIVHTLGSLRDKCVHRKKRKSFLWASMQCHWIRRLVDAGKQRKIKSLLWNKEDSSKNWRSSRMFPTQSFCQSSKMLKELFSSWKIGRNLSLSLQFLTLSARGQQKLQE